jgi:hypothetical protein
VHEERQGAEEGPRDYPRAFRHAGVRSCRRPLGRALSRVPSPPPRPCSVSRRPGSRRRDNAALAIAYPGRAITRLIRTTVRRAPVLSDLPGPAETGGHAILRLPARAAWKIAGARTPVVACDMASPFRRRVEEETACGRPPWPGLFKKGESRKRRRRGADSHRGPRHGLGFPKACRGRVGIAARFGSVRSSQATNCLAWWARRASLNRTAWPRSRAARFCLGMARCSSESMAGFVPVGPREVNRALTILR